MEGQRGCSGSTAFPDGEKCRSVSLPLIHRSFFPQVKACPFHLF
jgi:hypothetical protein